MPFWLHFILGYLLATNVATSIVALSLLLIGVLRGSFDVEAYGGMLLITGVTGFWGYAYVMWSNHRDSDKPKRYWVFAAMKTTFLASVLFTVFSIIVSPHFVFGALVFLILPFTLAGGVAGGYVYALFRDRFPYL